MGRSVVMCLARLCCWLCDPVLISTINSSRPEHTKRTQGNAEQHKATHAGQAEPTQPKQHQQTKNQHRRTRTLLETTNDRKPKPTHQPQAAPIDTTTRGLPQPRRPSQPNLPRTTLDPMVGASAVELRRAACFNHALKAAHARPQRASMRQRRSRARGAATSSSCHDA